MSACAVGLDFGKGGRGWMFGAFGDVDGEDLIWVPFVVEVAEAQLAAQTVTPCEHLHRHQIQ